MPTSSIASVRGCDVIGTRADDLSIDATTVRL